MGRYGQGGLESRDASSIGTGTVWHNPPLLVAILLEITLMEYGKT
jgi:hypothetical protein